MTIRTLKVKLPYRYLWLKHIEGVDLSQHCARSFVGQYSKQVDRFHHNYKDIILPRGYVAHYLCGVLNYTDNLHLAMLEAPGEHAEVHDAKCDFELEDGILVPIREDYIPFGAINVDKREFRTCRNWQFAHWLRNNHLA